MLRLSAAFAVFAVMFSSVQAENHTISFVNNCGRGTPMLEDAGATLSTGQTVTVNGPLISAIAFLQTGSCGDNGEGCTVVQTTLENGASSTEISTSTPAVSVAAGFYYFNGCDGEGLDGRPGTVTCTANNVDLAITFCD